MGAWEGVRWGQEEGQQEADLAGLRGYLLQSSKEHSWGVHGVLWPCPGAGSRA